MKRNKRPVNVVQKREVAATVAVDTDLRQVTLSFASEEPCQQWFGTEVLLIEPESVDLSRFASGLGVVLFNHDPDKVLGKILDVRMDEQQHKIYATIEFDRDEFAENIWQKVLNKTLRGVSVGYSVQVWEEVSEGVTSQNGRFVGECLIAARWSALEISIVSVPADANVGIGRNLKMREAKTMARKFKNGKRSRTRDELLQEEVETVEEAAIITAELDDDPEKELTTEEEAILEEAEQILSDVVDEEDTADEENRNEDDDEDKERNEEEDKKEDRKKRSSITAIRAVVAERRRAVQVMDLCRSFNVKPDEYISKNSSIEQVQRDILKKLKTDNKASRTSRVSIGADGQDKFRAAATEAILLRGGMGSSKSVAGAKDLRGLSLRALAEECLEREGMTAGSVRRLDTTELFKRALTGSGNYPNILANVASKAMAQGYEAAPTTFEPWTQKGSNPDFKAAKHLRLSEAGELLEIPESGEFKHDAPIDEGVDKVILTYGRTFSITRQAMYNDDLDALTRIPARYAMQARQGINRLVYKLVGSNTQIYDGKNLFEADHDNIATTAASLSVESLGRARAAMRKQTNLRGKETLNITPKFLLVPTGLETLAEQLLNSIADPASSNSNVVNPFVNKLQVICDAELDQYSGKAWYLAAMPGMVDTIEVTYLNGQDTPTIESEVSFDTLGMRWRIFIDYGVQVLDYRGMYKNVGV